MSDIFISYPSENEDVASLLKARLRQRGIRTAWIDLDQIAAGQPIAERIQEGVGRSACCIFLLNSHSVSSTWCMAEVGAFWGAGKPVIIYPIEPHCEAPPFLAGLRRANSLEEILRACRIIIREDRTATLPSTLVKAFQESALVNTFRIPVGDHERERRVAFLVEEERKRPANMSFRLVASSGFNYLSKAMGKVWLRGLGEAIMNNEAEFSVVLESPFSPFAKARALANEVSWDHWYFKVNPTELIQMGKNYSLTVRVTEHPVNCSLFFTNEAVFYDPYLWGRPSKARPNENNFWVFEFRKAPDPEYDCYSLLEKHFSFLWDNSETLEEFFHSNASFSDRRNNFHEMLEKCINRREEVKDASKI